MKWPRALVVAPTSPDKAGRKHLVRAIKVLLALTAVVLAGRAVSHQWGQVRHDLGSLSFGWTALATLFALAAIISTALGWRAILSDLGSPLPMATGLRIYLIAQLGKYIPGSVFAMASQMELAARYGVSRARSGAASVVILALGIAAGGITAIGAVALLPRELSRPFLPLLLLLPLAGLLHPRPLNALINRALVLLRRRPLEHDLSLSGTGKGLAWSFFAWLLFGLHVWALCRDVGSTRPVLMLAITGFAVAWLLGFFVVIAPAGFGPREAVLVAVLGGSLATGTSGALVVAGVSRLILVVGDVGLALVGLLLGRSPAEHREA